MPSIFIWKSDSPNSSKDFIRCYLGSNWILEDNDNGNSLSYQLIQQQGFDYNNYSILVNNAKLMPIDWIGSELLEVIQCPYQLIKYDKYAKYELIGEWNRVTLSNTLELSEELCKIELAACEPSADTRARLSELRLIKSFFDAAKVKTEDCHDPGLGMDLLLYAKRRLERYIGGCKDCYNNH